eukprot:6175465-Pleurochrysis_carterae.AAC.2
MSFIPARYLGLSIPVLPCSPTMCATLPTYATMFTMRLCLGAVEACDGIEARSHFAPIMDGLSARPFARQKGR